MFLMKFSLCVTNILKVTRMLEEFHLYELRGDAPLMRVGVSVKKIHEWIEHMAIKVLSKKKNLTLVWLVEVCMVLLVSLQGITSSMLQET